MSTSDVWETFVFPTLVGVFLAGYAGRGRVHGLPHARGGVSLSFLVTSVMALSSPRSWGCFCYLAARVLQCLVFPTLVGVFPMAVAPRCWRRRLPHARGGVSSGACSVKTVRRSSPRSWGCFTAARWPAGTKRVFPTLVGVFLSISRPGSMVAGLPHARGGVSAGLEKLEKAGKSSPRSWGCFLALDAQLHGLVVFPTLVGVFPGMASRPGRMFRLPHARGGVSERLGLAVAKVASSPRSWGCFQKRPQTCQRCKVFPTLVGVFPMY